MYSVLDLYINGSAIFPDVYSYIYLLNNLIPLLNLCTLN